jgi:hypothetical protein
MSIFLNLFILKRKAQVEFHLIQPFITVMYSCIVGWVDVGLSTKARKRYSMLHPMQKQGKIATKKTIVGDDILDTFAA